MTPLAADVVRLRFPDGKLTFGDTGRLPEPDRLVGQELAIEAIDFAFAVDAGDFHLFAAGPPGTGRATLVRSMAARAARRRAVPPDVCCIYDFSEPDRPLTLRLPAGSARVFAAEMSRFVDFLRRAVPAALSSKEYRARHQAILEETLDERRVYFDALETRATAVGLRVEDTAANIQLLPLNDEGEEMSEEEFDALTEEQRRAIEDRERALRDDILEYLDHAKRLQDSAEESLEELDRLTLTRIVEPKIQLIRESLRFAEVNAWLDDVLEDVITTAETHLPDDDDDSPPVPEALRGARPPAERYEVNVLVDNTDAVGAPVVLELNPTYANLFGKVERRMSFGALETNHTLVRGGSVLRANGGILIIDAAALLSHPYAYPALKRALREGSTVIEDPDDATQGIAVVTLRPAPIPVRLQLVLLGTLDDYVVLRELDSEFAKLVKVRADFEESTELSDDIAQRFACFVGSVCRERHLRHFSQDAVAALIELGARLAGRKDEVSLRLDSLRSVIVEADHWARTDNGAGKLVERRHVERADDEARKRSSLFQQRMLREFRRKSLLIEVSGARVGQVNGLAVLGVGDILFGMPSRITAKTFVGEAGVVNIERETELSGQIHSKATLILNGFLGWMYAQRRALALSASLTFEQNYSQVEGDSASIAELVALLSSLADLPVRQDLAVTGSMSQHGEVQPIGGVNEKVEGFFRVCADAGLTGTQGVIVPVQNVADLNVGAPVAAAVAQGTFAIYPVSHVSEALELMLGMPAGVADSRGRFPANTVHGRVERRLSAMAGAVARRS
ncbi:MAG: AAA family ATPase [Myxococcales bacterium]|nr:AAA family ATPase [Myxococcales bacterium]MCB9519799.1 AAA family ATPase [Myxococcales bacterium]